MDDLVSKIKRRVKEIQDSNNYPGALPGIGCPWAEQIPRFIRGETPLKQNASIQKHLETCEECNLLLTALAVQNPPKLDYSWVKQGEQLVLDSVLSFRFGSLLPSPVMRSAEKETILSETQVTLPNDSTICIRAVKQGGERVVTVFAEDGRRCLYDLVDGSQTLIRSMDDARQFRFDMPDSAFTLVIDGLYSIHFDGEGL